MWSLGCIIAELFNKKVFVKTSKLEQYYDFMLEMMGSPPKKIMREIRNNTFLEFLKHR